MRYNMEEALAEVQRRGERLRKKQRHQNVVWLNGALALVILMTAFVARYKPNRVGVASLPYGASIAQSALPAEAGGYVLVGVITFFFGVALTIACIRYSNRRK